MQKRSSYWCAFVCDPKNEASCTFFVQILTSSIYLAFLWSSGRTPLLSLTSPLRVTSSHIAKIILFCHSLHSFASILVLLLVNHFHFALDMLRKKIYTLWDTSHFCQQTKPQWHCVIEAVMTVHYSTWHWGHTYLMAIMPVYVLIIFDTRCNHIMALSCIYN